MKSPFIFALSTLLGTIIGAGIFGIPYAVAQSGLPLALLYFFLLGGMVWLLHLFVGEICLRTKETHRLIGYGKKYLGTGGGIFFTFTTIFGVVGALLAYMVVGGIFLRALLAPLVSLSDFTASVLLWVVLSLVILRGIRLITKAELFMNAAIFLAVGLVLVLVFPFMETSNLLALGGGDAFLPFGVLLFAFVGWAAIPEIAVLFKERKDKRNLDNVISWATFLAVFLSLGFALAVVAVTGRETTQDALQGLVPIVGDRVIILGALFGLMSVAASFLVLGNYLKNSLRYDYGTPYGLAAGVAILIPLALFLLGTREFVPTLNIVGGVALSMEGLGILLLFHKAREKGERTPEYEVRVPKPVLFAIAAVLLLGMASVLFL
ncbi:MAG: aromatic amino acid transport family protein [Patescibacteria group bacterium]